VDEYRRNTRKRFRSFFFREEARQPLCDTKKEMFGARFTSVSSHAIWIFMVYVN
jgi:hypothetical protein